MISRRAFVAGSVCILAVPLASQAEQPKVVGVIGLTGPGSLDSPQYRFFRARLGELGWIEGKSLVFESRWADGQLDRLPQLIDDLLAVRPSVIFALSTPVMIAMKKTGPPVPVVFSHVSDPIASGIIPTLSRPGGNITGVSYSAPEAAGKLVQLLSEVRPPIRRVGVLWNKANHAKTLEFGQITAAAATLGISVMSLEFAGPEDFNNAVNRILSETPDALIVLADPVTWDQRQRLGDFVQKYRLPTMHTLRSMLEAGGLMGYGMEERAIYRRVAEQVDRILRGAKPADLPVEQPTQFELVINLKTAKALGLTIPPSLLLRADQVIE